MRNKIVKFAILYRLDKSGKNFQLIKLLDNFRGFLEQQAQQMNALFDIEYAKIDENFKGTFNMYFNTSKNMTGIDFNSIKIPGFTDVLNKKKFSHDGELKLSNFLYNVKTKELSVDVIFETQEFYLVKYYNGKFLLKTNSSAESSDLFTILDKEEISIVKFDEA